ncbi:MAG: hypothetical protein ACP5XB_26625 [Isosphaeraceae bacterium]
MLKSFFQNVRSPLTGKTLLLVLASAAVGAGLSAGIPPLAKWLEASKPTPAPAPLVDKTLIPLGRNYLAALGQEYAAAWIAGAKALESGQSVSSALKSVAQSWDQGRSQLFDRLLSPEFTKIIPDGQPDASTKPADRQAMAQAWRGLAAGLTSRTWLLSF